MCSDILLVRALFWGGEKGQEKRGSGRGDMLIYTTRVIPEMIPQRNVSFGSIIIYLTNMSLGVPRRSTQKNWCYEFLNLKINV